MMICGETRRREAGLELDLQSSAPCPAPHQLDLHAVTLELLVPRRVPIDVIDAVDQLDLKAQRGQRGGAGSDLQGAPAC